jgi:hypothetical protein
MEDEEKRANNIKYINCGRDGGVLQKIEKAEQPMG